MKYRFYSFVFFLFSVANVYAQSDTLTNLSIDNTLTLKFPAKHSDEKQDMRHAMEGRNNGIIYSLFISDEYNYTRIMNGLQLDSLYELIAANTLQIYSGDVIESDSYYTKFGELRGKYLNIKSSSKTNPYIAECYIICVSKRIFVMSTTYLSNYSEEQIKQAKDFVNTIKFNEKLGYNDQMNRY